MLKVMVCEGNEVLCLANVNEMSQDNFTDMIYNNLTEKEGNIFCDFAFEGIIMTDEDMKEFTGLVKDSTFEDYIKALKNDCVDDGSDD